jgi:hypothetical protein
MDLTPKKPKKVPYPKKVRRWGDKVTQSLDKQFGKEKTGPKLGFTNLGF